MSSASRRKGHNLERAIAKLFRGFGFKFAKTSREASRLLDSCKIDIANIPLNIQCKNGYNNNRPKYETIYKECKEELKKNYPPTDNLHNYPIVLVHKLNGRKKEDFQWVWNHKDMIKLLEDYYTIKQQLEELKEKCKC